MGLHGVLQCLQDHRWGCYYLPDQLEHLHKCRTPLPLDVM